MAISNVPKTLGGDATSSVYRQHRDSHSRLSSCQAAHNNLSWRRGYNGQQWMAMTGSEHLLCSMASEWHIVVVRGMLDIAGTRAVSWGRDRYYICAVCSTVSLAAVRWWGWILVTMAAESHRSCQASAKGWRRSPIVYGFWMAHCLARLGPYVFLHIYQGSVCMSVCFCVWLPVLSTFVRLSIPQIICMSVCIMLSLYICILSLRRE